MQDLQKNIQLTEPTPQILSDQQVGYSNISYGLATSKAELEQAFQLVWQGYTKVGLHPEDSYGSRITKYHLLPDAKVFIAMAWNKREEESKVYYEGRVIGTVTVLHDSCLGLPSEELCKKDIVGLRRKGHRLVEFMGFACDPSTLDQRVSLKLFTLAYEYCKSQHVSKIVASLTRRHFGYYRKFLGFKPMGALCEYEFGNGTPVQSHYTDVVESLELFKKRSAVLMNDSTWKHFWENEMDKVLEESAKMRPWTREQMEYFIGRCPKLLEHIDIETANTLSAEYKRYDIELCLTPR